MADQGSVERLPPQNLYAERSVLGAILRDKLAMAEVLTMLRGPEDFYQDAHQRIFRAMLCLDCAGRPIDLVTLADALQSSGDVENIGGYVYLESLQDAAPTSANAGYYSAIVRDKAILRGLIHLGGCIVRDAYNPDGEACEILDLAEKSVFAMGMAGIGGASVPISQAVAEAYNAIDSSSKTGHPPGISTGFIDLDRMFSLRDSELTILAARPSVGKTALACCIAMNAALRNKQPTFFVSLEMSRQELVERFFCQVGRISSSKLRMRRLDDEDWGRLIDAGGPLRESKLFIDDTAGQAMQRISATARRHKSKDGIKLVILDYLQLVEPEERRGVNRQEQVAAISRRLKLLAKEIHCPILALAQLNRQVEHAEREPQLSDLRDSGSLEQDADNVIFLHKDEASAGIVKVILRKQRNGPVGDVPLFFRAEHMRFEDCTMGEM